MSILTQFLFQLAFGLALMMAVTPWRRAPAGFYRVHLLVVMGLMTLSSLVALANPGSCPLWAPVAAAVLSYFGSVVWLYEKPRTGVAMLVLVALLALAGGWLSGPARLDASTNPPAAVVLRWLTTPSGGLLLGAAMTAMFLGHWYLNTPTMDLAPLRRLVFLLAAAALVRMAVSGVALACQLAVAGDAPPLGGLFWPLLALRWLAGLLGVLALAWMTWQTLKVPNTQSATGILYVAVIGTFVGELASQLLSAEAVFPL